MPTCLDKIEFNQQSINILKKCSIDDALNVTTENKAVNWIKVVGLENHEIIEELSKRLEIDTLTIEDILHTNQRPRLEAFTNYAYFVLRRVYYNIHENDFETEQITIILKENIVVSFQEIDDDLFHVLNKNLQSSNHAIRNKNADYLAYMLVDVIVDEYMEILTEVFEKIEDYEDELIHNSDQSILKRIFLLKKQLILLKKAVSPLIQNFFELKSMNSKFISKNVMVYFKDISDHVVKIDDNIDTFRETLSALIDTFGSIQSMKMNEVMKIFTIIATIFMPLTLITGIYGMNFQYIPETQWHYGYFFVLILLIIVGVGSIMIFKKKKWL